MLIDAQNLFSDAQAITAAAASTNTIDLGAVRNIGVGERLYVVLVVDVALTDSGNDSTVTVSLYADSTTSFTPDLSSTLFTIAAVAAIGTKYVAPIPPDIANLQYIQLFYTPNNGNLSTGSVTAFVTKDIDAYTSYADNVTIS